MSEKHIEMDIIVGEEPEDLTGMVEVRVISGPFKTEAEHYRNLVENMMEVNELANKILSELI